MDDVLSQLEEEGKSRRAEHRKQVKKDNKDFKQTEASKRGKRSKSKGREGEKELVAVLKKYGLEAERMPLSGSLGGKYSNDIVLLLKFIDVEKRGEVKRRKSGLKMVYKWLEQDSADYLFFRPDGDKEGWIVIMFLPEFVDLIDKRREE